MTVSFEVSKDVAQLIFKAMERIAADPELVAGAERMYAKNWWQNVEMDLVACHANGCEMDWQKLLDADDATFGHDVFGIVRNIDHDDGNLLSHFLPRCAL